MWIALDVSNSFHSFSQHPHSLHYYCFGWSCANHFCQLQSDQQEHKIMCRSFMASGPIFQKCTLEEQDHYFFFGHTLSQTKFKENLFYENQQPSLLLLNLNFTSQNKGRLKETTTTKIAIWRIMSFNEWIFMNDMFIECPHMLKYIHCYWNFS